MQGWIKLYRKVKDHPFFLEKRQFSKFEAWLDLLMSANHQENKVLLGNELIEVERGSFITSELKLMRTWGWSKSKVRAFLSLLEDEQMIVKKSDKKKTTITIYNYTIYQDLETTEKPQKDCKKTSKEHQKDTNKNEKNVKEDIYKVFDYWNSKKITVHRELTQKRRSVINARLEKYNLEALLKAIDNYKSILDSEKHFYSHKFTLEHFMDPKNLDRFLDDNNPFEALLKNEYRSKGYSNKHEDFDEYLKSLN